MKALLAASSVLACSVSGATRELKFDEVEMGIETVRGVANGLKLYDHVDNLVTCDYHAQSFLKTVVQSLSQFYYSEWETGVIRHGTWLFTDSMGLSSFALRNCYTSYASLFELKTHYETEMRNFPQAASEIHDNIITNQEQLNTQGFTSFIGLYSGRYQDFAFGVSRAIYLTMLEQHFTTYTPGMYTVEPKRRFQVTEDVDELKSRMGQHSRKLGSELGSEKKSPKVGEAIYPFQRTIFNQVHFTLEMGYEFIRGARVVEKRILDVCETRLTNYMLEFAAASDYIEFGELLEDNDIIREGWFRVFDSFLLMTDLTRGCWETYWRVGKSVTYLVSVNILSDQQTLLNLMWEYYQVSSNISVFFADFFFSDWLSFAYYTGDTVYRLMVVQHESTFDFN